ncbi:MAG: hypothetical protein DMG13_26745 [Acidobacteria bacterium]|nr:MAG: hypothetical protein DMG13_26745 [Acidobacteriota bacterium]
MFITKKFISRRTVLRGIGAAIALPFVEAMVPALTATAQTAANPLKRFGVVFVPLGERPGYWTPSRTGADFEFTPILKPLEPFRNSLTVISELCNPLDGHAVSVAAWLSGSVPFRTIAENVRAGTTIDQVIANKIGQDTPFPSLEVATEDFTGWIGGCDTAYSCAYMNTISWKTATTPLPMEINPRVLFERMFGRPGTSSQRLQRMRENRSILDSVREDVADLEKKLGAKDRGRLDDYLGNIREIEQRIQKAEQQATTKATVPDAPIGIPESFDEHARLMYDLLAVAWEANITRVFTYMKSRDASQRVYPNIGVMEPHHAMSHHGNNAEKLAGLVKLNTYHASLFAGFLERLQSTPDGDGSLLDHSLILFGSGMSESDTHSRLNIPTLLAGGLAGQMKGNRHIQAVKETPIANLMVSLGNKFGCDLEKFGISTGTVEI